MTEINGSPVRFAINQCTAGGQPTRAPRHMIGFIARSWHWASSLDWWERGVVGALVGALLFVLVPPTVSYVSTSFVAYLWRLFSSLDWSERAAVGALIGAVLLILVPAYALTSKA